MAETDWKDVKNKIEPHLSVDLFNSFDLTKESDHYFPSLLENKLASWISIYKENIQNVIDTLDIPINHRGKNFTLTQIEALCKGILSAVDLYYKGQVFDATFEFNKCISSMMWSDIFHNLHSIDESCVLYRARVSEVKRMSRQDLFHIPFEKRHLVSTKRYSIPGFPALYLADNTYTCWEEFNRYTFQDLWVSKFVPTSNLKIIYIERVEDFLKSLDKVNIEQYSTHVILYLTMFPLQIACTQKVLDHSAPFKPEYIIPQLLLQYVKQQRAVDGIKFPSTKVDYNTLDNIQCYNYVFPVKDCVRDGHCPYLVSHFNLTEPTNLEIEEILYNPAYPVTYLYSCSNSVQKIELIKDVKSLYIDTAFGKMESILSSREAQNIFC